jgi:hypothetical protein
MEMRNDTSTESPKQTASFRDEAAGASLKGATPSQSFNARNNSEQYRKHFPARYAHKRNGNDQVATRKFNVLDVSTFGSRIWKIPCIDVGSSFMSILRRLSLLLETEGGSGCCLLSLVKGLRVGECFGGKLCFSGSLVKSRQLVMHRSIIVTRQT